MTVMTGVLAKATVAEVVVWSAGLLLLLIVGMAGAAALRRRFRQDDAPASVPGFTLSDLRQMHRAGQLTDEEFNKAKEKIVTASVKTVEPAEQVPGVPPPRDSADAIRARRQAREGNPGPRDAGV
jgi:hypothetical protein